jgi:hypothetical protein
VTVTLERRLPWLVALWLVAVFALPAAAEPSNRALLVGVSNYPNLAARWQLQGPPNDVARLRELLKSGRFGNFPDANISALAGWPADAAARPTRLNIAREFQRLASIAQPGDQIVILLAGHGSQQPANRDAADPEPDGFDETFLPSDVGTWDGKARRVANAITDDEIGGWLAAIRAKKAFVWILFDSCHSGTMTRGVERQRGIPASELMPAEAATAPAQHRGIEQETDGWNLRADEGLVAMYAVQASQRTAEVRLPEGTGQWHGFFTYSLVEVLSQVREPLSYRELMDRVTEHYRRFPRFDETPGLEGTAANRAVLGRETLPERPPFLIVGEVPDGARLLNAGHLHGVLPDSILAVYPPAGAEGAARPIGYVRVTTSGVTDARVTPIAFEGHPAPPASALVSGMRCRLARVAVGGTRVRIGAASPSARSIKALRDLERLSDGMASGQTTIDGASWILVEDKTTGAIVLEHQSAPVASDPGKPVTAAGPGNMGDVSAGGRRVMVAPRGDTSDLGPKLAAVASTIARAEALRHLITPGTVNGAAMRLETTAFVDDGASDTRRRLEIGTSGRTLRPKQRVEFHVRNAGTKAVDLTVLFLDGAYGVRALYPQPGQQLDTRLAPGHHVVLGPLTVTDDTLGDEDLIVIGLPPSTPSVDLSVLQQFGLDVTTRGAERLRLGDLLARALKGSRGRADSVLAPDDEHAVSSFSWRTVASAP